MSVTLVWSHVEGEGSIDVGHGGEFRSVEFYLCTYKGFLAVFIKHCTGNLVALILGDTVDNGDLLAAHLIIIGCTCEGIAQDGKERFVLCRSP